LKVLNREFHQLKNSGLFVMLTVRGQRKEQIDLATEGITRKLVFFSEAPKTMHNCTYFEGENLIELGGAEMETERRLYLIAEPK